ncbi:MAG: hypothetical protein GY906_23200 [bacterium]|nr:hypothetical protein [bacterium]
MSLELEGRLKKAFDVIQVVDYDIAKELCREDPDEALLMLETIERVIAEGNTAK